MAFGWFGHKKTKTRQPRLMQGQDEYVFRRSRTLTGSTSANVSSSAEKRGQLKTERLKMHERKQRRNKLLRLIAGLLVVAGLIVYLITTLIKVPQISYAQPGSKPPTFLYQESIGRYFADHPIERFGFILRSSQLEEFIKRQHSEVKNLAVERAWYGGDVQFNVYFRQPLLVWQTGGQKFYVDETGTAFTYNHFAQPSVVVTDKSGISPDVSGGAVATSRFINFLGKLVGALNDYNKGKVKEVIIPASTRQVDIKLEGRDYIIKTHSDRDPLEQAEDIANTLNYFDQKGIKPEYVDVRVAHKAFYK